MFHYVKIKKYCQKEFVKVWRKSLFKNFYPEIRSLYLMKMSMY